MKPKNWKRRVVWISITAIIFSLSLVTFNYIGDAEVNHPFLVFEANSQEQQILAPYADENDSNILYLRYVGSTGDSLRIDLRKKQVSPFHFDVIPWENIKRNAVPYTPGDGRPGSPVYMELRGYKLTQRVLHLFGFPYPDSIGTYQAHLRFGHWYVMDNRNGTQVSLLRIRVWNSELNWDDIGRARVSPDGKWIFFQMGGIHPTVYMFNRTAIEPENF